MKETFVFNKFFKIFSLTTLLMTLIYYISFQRNEFLSVNTLQVLKTTRVTKIVANPTISTIIDSDLLRHSSLGEFTFETLDGHFWILNGNVLQFGTIMSLRKDQKVEIEAMIASVGIDLAQDATFIKFIIKLNSQTVIIKDITLTHVARCLLTNEEYANVVDNKIAVGLIDIREYQPSKRGRNPRIYGRSPEFFDQNIPKLQAMLLCACSVRDIKDHVVEHIVTWARINKLFGVHKVQVYSVDNQSPGYHKLKHDFSDLLEVYGYEQNVTELCRIHNASNQTACVSKYGQFFYRGKTNFAHEDLLMKYCYLRSMYTYQYVSNLDHDELIMPRRFSIYDHQDNVANSLISKKENCDTIAKNLTAENHIYNINEYLLSLQRAHGERVSSFRFANFVFMTKVNDMFADMFANPNSTKFTYKDMRLKNPIQDRKDLEYFEQLKSNKNLTDCIYEKLLSKTLTGANQKYTNVIAKYMKMNQKCVFNTDWVESISAHGIRVAKENTILVDVPVARGVLSHFRDHDYEYLDNVAFYYPAQSIRDWVGDLEFFSFLVKHFSK
jgi:hypothetical protein